MKTQIQGMMVLVVLVYNQHTEAYTMDYFDCNKPQQMTEYDLRTYCMNEVSTSVETTKYHVLQKRKNIKMSGYSCQMIRSTFTMHCGMFSHQEMVRIPDIEIKQDVSLHSCQNIITTGYWTTREGTVHKIKIGEESILHISEKGVLHEESNKIWCEGEEMRINGNIIEGVVKMVQYRVTIKEEKFVMEKQRVEVVSNHIRLPPECTVETGGCIASASTYLWNPPNSQCKLVKINTGKFTTENGWLVEHNAKLLFKIVDSSQAPFGCPTGQIYHTEYADLYLTKEEHYPHIEESIEIGLYVKQSSDYVLYQTERMTNNLAESTYRDMCKQLYDKSKDEVIPMTNEKFGRRSGDVLYTFNCMRKTGKIMASKDCHDRIPLENNVFVDSRTRIATKHATMKECNDLFPEAIRAKEGWISLPNLKPIQEPNKFTRRTNTTHEDMSRGGLYTVEEMEMWEKFISYGDFRESLLSSISTGACVHREICKGDAERQLPRYNLNKLLEEAREEMNPMAKFKAVIRDYGAYLSAFVIFSWICRAALWIALLFNTIIREGKNVAVALLYATCCGTLYKTGKIRRHNNKKSTPSAPPAQELQTGLLRPV